MKKIKRDVQRKPRKLLVQLIFALKVSICFLCWSSEAVCARQFAVIADNTPPLPSSEIGETYAKLRLVQWSLPEKRLKFWREPGTAFIQGDEGLKRTTIDDLVSAVSDWRWGLTQKPTVIVYIHGYNTPPKAAARSAMRLSKRLSDIPLILYYWNSHSALKSYVGDRYTAQAAGVKLGILLHEIRAKSPELEIHVVAFSLGSVVILPNVLMNHWSDGVQLKFGDRQEPGDWRFAKNITTLTLVAPAERSSIAELALELSTTSVPVQNVFVMRSQNDLALWWAAWFGEEPFGRYEGCNERLINEIRWINVSKAVASTLSQFWKMFDDSHDYLKYSLVTDELRRIILGNRLRFPEYRFDDCARGQRSR